MKQCRSIGRALRRGHPLHSGSNIYMSKKESRILMEIYKAALRKKSIEQDQTIQTEDKDE
jgi:hypothetical protein